MKLFKTLTLSDRLKLLRHKDWDNKASVEILWNEYSVPYIHAESDEDVPYWSAIVQYHLRQTQFEIMRLLSRGELSRATGGSSYNVDFTLRAFDFAKNLDTNFEALSEESKFWLQRMAQAINDYNRQNPKRSFELIVTGIRPEQWTAKDILKMHKFASADVNWMVLAQLMNVFNSKDWASVWSKIRKRGMGTYNLDLERNNNMAEVLGRFMGRTGSNCFVVSPEHSATGSVMMGGDPHLGVSMPNVWILLGIKSPTINSVGYCLPSMPVPVIGRNANITWGGTNMWGVSSHFRKASAQELENATWVEEKIPTRFGRDKKIKFRKTPAGTIVTDTPIFKSKTPLILEWAGYDASDELKTFIDVNRAKTWNEFENAFETFGVSAMNFLYGDVDGNIGHVHAIKRPVAKNRDLEALVVEAEDSIETYLKPLDFPRVFNPESGFIVSSNNPSEFKSPRLSFFHAPEDRKFRISQLIKRWSPLDFKKIHNIQLDTFSPSAWIFKEYIVKRILESNQSFLEKESLNSSDKELYKAFIEWDGHYEVESKGPVAFEIFSFYFVKSYYRTLGYSEASILAFTQSVTWRYDLLDQVKDLTDQELSALVVRAFDRAVLEFENFATWGDMHHLLVSHPLSRIPILGRQYQRGPFPYSGGNETVMKAAHSFLPGRVKVNFGAQARFNVDLSNIDHNEFALLGGNDGHIHSEHAWDLFECWMKSKYIKLPLSYEAFKNSAMEILKF